MKAIVHTPAIHEVGVAVAPAKRKLGLSFAVIPAQTGI